MSEPSLFARTREEVEALIGQIGDLERAKVRRGLEYGAHLADLKKAYDEDITAMDRQIAEAETKVKGWCAANRSTICKPKQKSARFSTGVVKFRAGRLSVEFTKPAEVILSYLKANGFGRFVRTTEDVDKTALAKEPDVAETIPGVTLKRGEEQIVVEPVTA
jgi:phage host-nuclease inhibitor protein Gam